ncbi:MAG: type I-U CRISPR-associated protein Csb2 [Minicystis sp.]
MTLACERIGLPRPARVTVMPAAPLAGADKVRHFPAFKAGNGTQRVLVHATLTFEEPVRGPILLGAGRYLGLGLFRPLRDHG